MKNNTIIITGASSGMGKYMAKKFADNGFQVTVTGRNSERLQTAAEELTETAKGRILPITMDVRKTDDISHMIDTTVEKFGGVDYLINNAAGNFICSAEELSTNGWDSVIDIVLNGTFYCSQAVGKYWINQRKKGAILNMVATYAWNAGAGVCHSAAAKAGVLSLTRTLAVEWGAKYGIRTNAIAPGPIERTGGAEKLFESQQAADRTMASVPLGRLGRPEEIAELAYFILSDKAAYMNGEVVTLDGGQWLNKFPF